jgi:GMP synthase-like glutamine amidotransferase
MIKKLRIHCFQHVPFEGLGCIHNWIENNGHSITYTKFFEPVSIPEPSDYDWLIVMGGPMGVYETAKYNWLADEISAIKQAIDSHKTVIGICLGSQLIAAALGAKVFKNPEKEIGWFDISLTEQGKKEALSSEILKINSKVFHWHGDTFDLPVNAIHLAYSAGCRNQAFLYHQKVLGLQFHFEATEQGIDDMVNNGRNELIGGNYIQWECEINAQKEFVALNNKKMFHILDFLNK